VALSAESHLLLVQFLEAQPSSEVERKQEVLGGGGAEGQPAMQITYSITVCTVLMGTVQYLRNRIYKQPFPLREGHATPDPGSD
jgi:hypothetical protein